MMFTVVQWTRFFTLGIQKYTAPLRFQERVISTLVGVFLTCHRRRADTPLSSSSPTMAFLKYLLNSAVEFLQVPEKPLPEFVGSRFCSHCPMQQTNVKVKTYEHIHLTLVVY